MVTMERFLLLFCVAAFLCGTGLRAEVLSDAQTASVPALFSPNLLPLTFLGLLLALGTFLYTQSRRG